MDQRLYRKLQQHLNRMPVGFPRAFGGIDIRLLKRLFTPMEARLALFMGHHLEPIEAIQRRAVCDSFSQSQAHETLHAMARKGAILNLQRNGSEHYALVPLVVGMFEFQAARLSLEMYRDTLQYFKRGYALEYLSTALPQTRVIPIRQSIRNQHAVATYDEVRQLVRRVGKRIGVAPCICRTGKDLVGEPCSKTQHREVCLVMRDLFEHGHRFGMVRAISAEKALETLDKNEKAGLVLQPSNEQEPQFVCSCCQCCCGILGMLNTLPKPVDFTASNYRARIDRHQCNGCEVCMQRCPMNAIVVSHRNAQVNRDRCIGCGVCVPACRQQAIDLSPSLRAIQPPATTEALYARIDSGKPRIIARAKTAAKIVKDYLRIK